MARQDLIDRINKAFQDREPYANYVVSSLQRMNKEQFDYFMDKVAPYYMDGQQYPSWKDMEYMGRAVEQNKAVERVLGMDYRRLGTVMDSLPEFLYRQQAQTQYQQPYVQQKTTAQRIQDMNDLVQKHVMSPQSGKHGIQNQMFCQSGNLEYNRLPLQGWKFHISARNLEDYEKLLEKALPEFERAGVAFKVVKPETFDYQMTSSQAGKAITIYPTPNFNINNFSPELKSMLFENSICPQGDAQIQGRICARYGAFRKSVALLSQDGQHYQDPRGQSVKPDFVREASAEQILNFYSDSAQRYNATGDAKTYLQEMVTLTQGNGKDSPWVTLLVQPGQENYADSILKNTDRSGHSFQFQLGEQTYFMVNADQAPNVLNELQRCGVAYDRPDWDKHYNLYQMDSPEMAEQIAGMMKCNMDIDGVPTIEAVEVDGIGPCIKVDTTMNKEFEDFCNSRNIEHTAYAFNHTDVQFEMNGFNIHHDVQELSHDTNFIGRDN